MIDFNTISHKISQILQAQGVSKAQYEIAVDITEEINYENDTFSLYRTLEDNALSITVYCDNKKGSITINQFGEEEITAAIVSCVAFAKSGLADVCYDIAPKQEPGSFHSGCEKPDIDLLFSRSEELTATISEQYPEIRIKQLITGHKSKQRLFVNTNGTKLHSTSGHYYLNMIFSAHTQNTASSFFTSALTVDSLDKPFLSLGSLSADLKNVSSRFHTVTPPDKFIGALLLTPAVFEEFLTYLTESFASDNIILAETGRWIHKLNKPVADSQITVRIAPSDPRIVCGEVYSPDGFISEDDILIENGILKSFRINQYTARKTGLARAKNSSSCFIVDPGSKSLDELIKDIPKGVFIGRFSGGEPGANGDISGIAKNSFLIENGKITGALRETMISGNLADMLQNLLGISRETIANGTTVLPYIAFDGFTITGKTK